MFRLSVLFALLLCIRLSRNASLSLQEKQKYKNLIEGQGLYNADDDVVVLTKDNFKQHIYGQKNAWIVEFYNSWCGFCQRFAPSWKSLATDIKEWQGVVNVGAIDCSDDNNSVLCREFEIMGYPTLRYFHEDYKEGLGDNVDKGTDMEDHKVKLLQHMIDEREQKRAPDVPPLLPYQHPSLHQIFDANIHSKYVFLVIDVPASTIGAQLSLDFHKYKKIGVRYATSENGELVKNVNAKKLPFMMVLTDQNKSHVFPESLTTRTALRAAIIEYVKPDVVIDAQNKRSDIYTGKWLDVEVPDIGSLMEEKARSDLRAKVRQMGDVNFQADLESALRYSLKTEVGSVKEITGDKLKALHDYVNVLFKYFHFGANGKMFLMEILDMVRGKSHVDGAEVANIVSKYDDDSKKVFSSAHQWIACQGSTKEKRGYTCGLWKLFHYLTVQASNNTANPKEVLHAMHGYVRHFFGCNDCSQHFQEMAHKKDMEGVTSADSAVLWLWMAHNQVNRRLAGDATEDPEFPKLQFPSVANCPKCHKGDNSWDYEEVLAYLKNMYSAFNIRYIGADSRILHPGLGAPPKNGTSIFEQIDASMCFILYLLSFFLIFLIIRLFLRRGYRKKMYAHDILGKV